MKHDSGIGIEGAGERLHTDHHCFISTGFVAAVKGEQVCLPANADVAITSEEEEGGEPLWGRRGGTGQACGNYPPSVEAATYSSMAAPATP